MRKFLILPLLSVGLLTGCSDNPGPDQVREALRNNDVFMNAFQAGLQLEASMTGKLADIGGEFNRARIEVGSCANASDGPGVVCEIRMNREVNGQTISGIWQKGRFFQAGGQWQVDLSAR